MKKIQSNRLIAAALCTILTTALSLTPALFKSLPVEAEIPARVGEYTTIPNTTSTLSNYNQSFLSATGFAGSGVHDRSDYIGTEAYRQVSTSADFVKAIYDAQQGTVKVIEIMKDLNLGYGEVKVDTLYNSIFTSDSMNAGIQSTNPLIDECGGISKISIKDISGLTIFSQYGATLNHTELDITESSSDVVIRNIAMDGIWQWDNTAHHKESGLTYIKVNGKDVWIDHCSFTIAPDGNIDMESGANGVTFSWCKFGLSASEGPANKMINASISFMEDLYQKDLEEINAGKKTDYTYSNLNSGTRYSDLRKAGATPEEIMEYTAYHSKVHLVGSGDKDLTTNPNLQITLAYNWYRNVAQRVPRIRQGMGHLYNCFIDDMEHMNLEAKFKNDYGLSGGYTLSRCIDAQNGASIAADTCVFNGINEPLTGNELQNDGKSDPSYTWGVNFSNTYNHALIVNSKTTNTKGESYSGGSWDNNGENLFTAGYTWHDKSTLNKWCWKSKVLTTFSGETYPGVFDVSYDYDAKLPYSYQLLPLDNVQQTVTSYSGMGTYDMTPAQWLKTAYSASDAIEPAGENKIYIGSSMAFTEEEPVTYVGDKTTLSLTTNPVKITNPAYTWFIKSIGSTQKASIDATTGEITALAPGKATVTCKCTSINGTSISASVTLTVKKTEDKPVTSELPVTSAPPANSPAPSVSDLPVTSTPQTSEPVTASPTPQTSEPVTASPTPAPVTSGDVNYDGTVDLYDAQLTLRIALNIVAPTEQEIAAADYDKDQKITLTDAQMILKLALNIPV